MSRISETTRYEVCGLTIDSPIDLPGLITSDNEPDIVIRYAREPLRLPSPTIRGVLYVADACGCLITAPGAARYLVEDGRRILVEPLDGAPPESVRLFLLGAALGMALCQRQLLVWHASAVTGPDGRAVVLAGHSGRGKSTLTAALLRQGYRMLADDLVVVTDGHDGRPHVQRAFPRLKLREDAVARLGIDARSLPQVRPGIRKFFVPADGAFADAAAPLRCVYVLDYRSADAITITPVSGHERLSLLRPYLFAQKYVEHRGIHLSQFPIFSKAVTSAPVRVLSRRPHAPVDAVVAALQDDLAS